MSHQELLCAFIKHKNLVFNGEQPEKESSIRVRMACLVLPSVFLSRQIFFYPTLTLMMNSYIITLTTDNSI